MKKVTVFMMAMAILAIYGEAMAGTELLPSGSKVSAIVSGNQATVKITGVQPTMVELYSYGGVKNLGAKTEFAINLDEGSRFNFKFGKGANYVLLTPEMVGTPPSWIGPGITIDTSSEAGSCFRIVK